MKIEYDALLQPTYVLDEAETEELLKTGYVEYEDEVFTLDWNNNIRHFKLDNDFIVIKLSR